MELSAQREVSDDVDAEISTNTRTSAPPIQAPDPLATVSAMVTVAAFSFAACVLAQMPEGGPWLLDPMGLSLGTCTNLFIASVLGKASIGALFSFLGSNILDWPRMDEGGGDKVKRLESLQFVDYLFILLGSAAEFVGVCHVLAMMDSRSDHVGYRLREFNLTNGPFAFLAILMLNDAIQFPFHLLAQSRFLFPFCHKQHRRQLIPFRGYADALNKHPLEMLVNYGALTASFQVIITYFGVHFACTVFMLLCMMAVDLLHHLPFNVEAHLPIIFPLFARDHQTHHRLRRCNHGVMSSLYDKLFGTWEDFHALDEPAPEPEKPLMWYEKTVDPAAPSPEAPPAKAGRPAFFPSPWSVAVCMVLLLQVVIAIEMSYTQELPRFYDLLPLARPVIVVFNVGLFCVAVESACATDAEPKSKKTRLYTKPTMRETEGADVLKEAVTAGHFKKTFGGKDVWKPKMSDARNPKIIKRE